MTTKQNIYSIKMTDTVSHTYHMFRNHTLAFVYDGRLHLRNQCGETLSIGSGDCAFIGKNSYSHIYAEPDGNIPCRVLFLSIPREFLCEYYQTLPVSDRELTATAFPALHRLKLNQEVRSLFMSWMPYIQNKQELSEELLRLKLVETIQTMLNITNRYASVLFDFAGKCQMNVFDLLRKPEEEDMEWKDLEIEPYNKLN